VDLWLQTVLPSEDLGPGMCTPLWAMLPPQEPRLWHCLPREAESWSKGRRLKMTLRTMMASPVQPRCALLLP
jgi:hypothetical protein